MGVRCRYDGAIIDYGIDKVISSLFRIVDVCPEVDIGLSVPRPPIRFVKRGRYIHLIQKGSGKRLKKRLKDFARDFLKSQRRIEFFLLKSRSPSCGRGDCKVYRNMTDEIVVGYTDGVFAEECKRLFPETPIYNEEEIKKILQIY